MNDKNASFSCDPSLEDRQAAERKLCRLFKSFGIDAPLARDRLIDPYLDRAAAFWRPHAGIDFAKLALEEAEADLQNWFVALLGDCLDDRNTALMTGRAAFLMCDGSSRFADLLLMPVKDLPASFVAAMLDQAPAAVPPSEIGEMHHQPYQAWSPTSALARALPIERGGMLQSLSGLVRRDAGAGVFGWRNTGPTS